MLVKDLKMGEEIVTWEKEGKQTHIAINRVMRKAKLSLIKPRPWKIETSIALWLIESKSTEEHRLQRALKMLRDKDPRADEPVTIGINKDISRSLFDGIHRYVAKSMCNIEIIQARVVPYSMWSQFIVTDYEQVFAKHFSGITRGLEESII